MFSHFKKYIHGGMSADASESKVEKVCLFRFDYDTSGKEKGERLKVLIELTRTPASL